MYLGTLPISEAELARDPCAILARVELGMEVVVERDHRPVATIRPPKRSGRPISECIASAKASGSKAVVDDGFGDGAPGD
jgi:antitoxin (DNA-binding transcriptional repressor) of toxin-antitoxin stability system